MIRAGATRLGLNSTSKIIEEMCNWGGVVVTVAEIWCICLNPAVEITFSATEGWAYSDKLITATDFGIAAGGKATNVARVLWQIGHPNTRLIYLAAACDTTLGHSYKSLLRDKGIAIPALNDIRVSVVVAETRSGATKVIRTDGHTTVESPKIIASLRVALEHLRKDDWLVCAGSLPAGLSSRTYTELSAFAAEQGAHTVVDCGGSALRAVLDRQPTLVKVNLNEARSYLDGGGSINNKASEVPSQQSVEDLAKNLHDLGATVSIVTDGPNRLIASQSGIDTYHPTPKSGISATGAGDAFLAGLLASMTLIPTKTLTEHVAYACELGGEAVERLSAGQVRRSALF